VKKDKRSWALRFALRFNSVMTNKIIGWLWAANSISLILYFLKFEGTGMNMFWAVICFLAAVLFWNRADLEIKK